MASAYTADYVLIVWLVILAFGIWRHTFILILVCRPPQYVKHPRAGSVADCVFEASTFRTVTFRTVYRVIFRVPPKYPLRRLAPASYTNKDLRRRLDIAFIPPSTLCKIIRSGTSLPFLWLISQHIASVPSSSKSPSAACLEVYTQNLTPHRVEPK